MLKLTVFASGQQSKAEEGLGDAWFQKSIYVSLFAMAIPSFGLTEGVFGCGGRQILLLFSCKLKTLATALPLENGKYLCPCTLNRLVNHEGT